MTKYSYERKIEVVNSYRNGEGGYQKLSNKFGIPCSLVRAWVTLAKFQGLEALQLKRSSTSLSSQEKFDILNYKVTNELSISDIAVRFLIDGGTISRWEREFMHGGINSLKSNRGKRQTMTAPKPNNKTVNDEIVQENYALKLQIQRLKMELAVSKKLEALAIEKQRTKNLHK